MSAQPQDSKAAAQTAVKAALEKASAKPPKLKPIHASKGGLAHFKRNEFFVIAPDDMPQSALECPDTWTHAGRDFGMFDRVEIVQSGRWSEGVVCDVGLGFTNIKIIQSIELPARRNGGAAPVPEGFEIRRGGPGQSPFIVIRLKDGYRMNQDHEKLETYDVALRWLLDLRIWK